MMSRTWVFIIIASLVSFGFRAIPVLFKNKLGEIEKSSFIIFLNYTACAIIGGIIYITAFHSESIEILYHAVNYNDLLKILILIASFIINLKLKNPIITFLICIISYAGLSYFFL